MTSLLWKAGLSHLRFSYRFCKETLKFNTSLNEMKSIFWRFIERKMWDRKGEYRFQELYDIYLLLISWNALINMLMIRKLFSYMCYIKEKISIKLFFVLNKFIIYSTIFFTTRISLIILLTRIKFMLFFVQSL